MSIFYNYSLSNDTLNDKLLDSTDNSARPILDKADDYKMAIVKFSLPASSINTFMILDDSFNLEYGFNTNPISYSSVTGAASMYQNSNFVMRSIDDFIENFNRTSLIAYRGLLDSADAAGFACKKTVTNAGNFSLAGTTAQSDINFVMTSGLALGMTTGYVKLDMKLYGTSVDQNVEVQLIDPNNVSSIVCASKRLGNNFVTFEDSSINNQLQSYNSVLTGDFQPLESFVKFNTNTTSQVGTWKVRIINRNAKSSTAFNMTYDISLTCYFVPNCRWTLTSDTGVSQYVPKISPTLSTSGDKLELLYDTNSQRSGFYIRLSNKLFNILGFPGYSTADSMMTLKLPQTRYTDSTDLAVVSYVQPVSTLYKLLDISEIQVRSSTLPISGEIDVLSRSNIICSIDTVAGDLNNNIYQFYNTQLEDRAYELISSAPLRELNLSVWVRYRSTNKTVPVYIPPLTTFTALLKFIKS